jgi:anionic cell wall polymer biosynthesis LytR-Cps2A-Psr (LCP) family protein
MRWIRNAHLSYLPHANFAMKRSPILRWLLAGLLAGATWVTLPAGALTPAPPDVPATAPTPIPTPLPTEAPTIIPTLPPPTDEPGQETTPSATSTPKPTILPPAPRVVLPPGTFNVALLGVDSRPTRNLKNTDVIIIASVNLDVPAITLLSIPRDMPAYLPNVGMAKINQAYAVGGPDLFKQTIRYNLGLEIDHYATVNFAGLVRAVDVLGGVDVLATCPLQHTFPRDPYYIGGSVVAKDYVDTFTGEVWPAGSRVPLLRIVLPKPGVYRMNGLQALAYVRARFDIPGGDVDRGRREQRMVRALLAKIRQVGSLTKLTELYDAVRTEVETDLSLEAILRYAQVIDKLGDAVVRSFYLAGDDDAGAALEGVPRNRWNRYEYVQKALNVALNQRANEGIPVAVLDGTGDPGFALVAADRLKEVGFTVTEIRPADRPFTRTVVLDHTTSEKGNGLDVLLRGFKLSKANVVRSPAARGPRFTVIVGPDFNTCYYAPSLQAAGSQPIEVQPPRPLPTTMAPLARSVVVTDVESLRQAVTASLSQTVTATALLEGGALPTGTLSQTVFVVSASGGAAAYSAPNPRARILGRLNRGAEVQALGRSLDGAWVQFQMPRTGRLAWVSRDALQPKADQRTDSAATPQPVGEAPRVVVRVGSNVNVRSGPGTRFSVIGALRPTQSAPLIGRSTDSQWWQIEFGARAGWVAARNVLVRGDASRVPVVAP